MAKNIELLYSKKKVQKAGEKLIIDSIEKDDPDAYDNAMQILSNWRECHEHPLHAVTAHLKDLVSKTDKYGFVVSRLKRSASIIAKLKRLKSMKLRNMQDIGGCRVVVTTKKKAYRLLRELNKRKDFDVDDYIEHPKKDGYRSIHLNKKFLGQNPEQSFSIEIQLRSQVQHSWATAVEIIDLFTHQNLKASDGSEDWKEFFKHVSEEFDKLDSHSYIASESLNKVYKLSNKLKVKKVFKSYAETLNSIKKANIANFDGYYLVKVNLNKKEIEVVLFRSDNFDNASKSFLESEKKHINDDNYFTSLVSTSSVVNLETAYPNFFADSSAFLKNLDAVLNAYRFYNRSFLERVIIGIKLK